MPLHDHYTSPTENQVSLRNFAEVLGGPRGTFKYQHALQWLLGEARAGRIGLVSECNDFPSSTISAETACQLLELQALGALWKPKRQILDAMLDPIAMAEALTEGAEAIADAARMRDKADRKQEQMTLQAEFEEQNGIASRTLITALIDRVKALDPRYKGEHADSDLIRDIERERMRNPTAASGTCELDLWAYWVVLEECYSARAKAWAECSTGGSDGAPNTPPSAPRKGSKRRGRGVEGKFK